ncbi:uncharacterized protein LOC126699233 isoform X3 [Quercus robur]|uniref:uncharacterized protein LOC126699233 isoform X3 n=1 Tax=Quercus robur TaxID=38942 RepID=UPI002161D3C4|nr:uncharacterized protein LOC126699233 isoform X3 [Quercus robur]
MLLLSQAPNLSAKRCSLSSSPLNPKFTNPKPFLFSNRKPKLTSTSKPLNLTLAKPEGGIDSSSATKPTTPFHNDQTVFVGQENVPLEGVIQFDKPTSDSSFSSRLNKWGWVALLAGGDVLALLLFAAIGRFSHGFTVFDTETLRTADPFIAGWFLSAYFLGGYAEDGRGMNGPSKGVIAAAKSWALGIPLGIVIRSLSSGHFPPYNFILVTMGSTAVLLVGWRTILYNILPNDKSKKSDVYRRGSPFELFELLTSLVRRW